MKRQSYITGALTVSAGGFVAKLLGALYRIPLIAALGGEGMGIYQMIYPLYCILLTVSASGIPTGIARLISAGAGDGAERTAFKLYGAMGLIGSFLMFALSSPLAAAQGEEGVALCCKIMSPSVFFVSAISVVRGYFQGMGDMRPTAFTEVIEQLIKVVFGVVLTRIYAGDTARATAAAVAAVTISEAFTALLAVLLYLGSPRKRKPLYKVRGTGAGSILSYTVPLTFSAIAAPLSQLAESIAVVNILRVTNADATALYGVFSGCAVTLINLPVSLAYGLAAASVPRISPLAQRGDVAGAKRETRKALLYTLILSLPCAFGLYIFSPLAARFIFPSLSEEYKALLVTLVRVMAVSAVASSLAQTSAACITSLGNPRFGAAAQWISGAARVALSALLISFTPLSVVGAALSANCAYLVAVVLNFCYIISVKKRNGNEDNSDRSGYKKRRLDVRGGDRA